KEKTKQRISSEDIIVYNIVAYVWGFIGIVFISVFSDLQALIVSRWLLVLVPYLCVIVLGGIFYGLIVGIVAKQWMMFTRLPFQGRWIGHVTTTMLLNIVIAFVIATTASIIENYILLATGVVLFSALVTVVATALAMRQRESDTTANHLTNAKLPTVDFKK
ncbi:MAG: hypothetical protein AAFV98_11815, partial [Chloroflexota bacterium]